MKKSFTAIALILFAVSGSFAGQAAQSAVQPVKEAAEADVSSLDGIIRAVYEVISGDAGEKRDWDRFRSLFHKDARLIPTAANRESGILSANAVSPEDYIKRSEPFFAKNGFHEREIARRVDQFGGIAQVFSTYHAFKSRKDNAPFIRGINSFQLLNDGKRWWIVTIYWQPETPENPIPEKYLKGSE